jgi:hypothetical protein
MELAVSQQKLQRARAGDLVMILCDVSASEQLNYRATRRIIVPEQLGNVCELA